LGDVTHHSPAYSLAAAFIPTDLPLPFSVKLVSWLTGLSSRACCVFSLSWLPPDHPISRRSQSTGHTAAQPFTLTPCKQIKVIFMRFDGEKVETLSCARLHTIFSFWTTDLPAARGLHRPGGSWLQVADAGVDGFAFMRSHFISDGGVVDGIHSSRLNCYRIPARGLVTVLSPWVHAARWRFWLLDHDPSALDAYGMRSRHLLPLEMACPRELIDFLCGCRDLAACRHGWWSKVTASCMGPKEACMRPHQPVVIRSAHETHSGPF